MSTPHTILDLPERDHAVFEGASKSRGDRVKIVLDERSGGFDLYVAGPKLDLEKAFVIVGRVAAPGARADDGSVEVASNLSCADLRQIRDRIDEVLSYFDEHAPYSRDLTDRVVRRERELGP